MSIPYAIDLDAGGTVLVSVVGDKVLLVFPTTTFLTRAECEHLGDVLWAAGFESDPPSAGGAAVQGAS